jgi:hypothetical protein
LISLPQNELLIALISGNSSSKGIIPGFLAASTSISGIYKSNIFSAVSFAFTYAGTL